MENLFFFRPEERILLKDLYRSLLRLSGKVLRPDDCANLKNYLVQAGLNNFLKRDVFDLNPIITDMETSLIVAQEIGLFAGFHPFRHDLNTQRLNHGHGPFYHLVGMRIIFKPA